MEIIARFGIFETALTVDKAQAPVAYSAEFAHSGMRVTVPAFRDGDDRYLVRFMPCETGEWSYTIRLGDASSSGTFECVDTGLHGPVMADGTHFRHADGKRYLPFGTTCYAWTHQPQEQQDQTLQTLKTSPFNKIRMCIFPKSMPYNNNEPELFPFHKGKDRKWDVNRPDEHYWRHLDKRIAQLSELGVEADLILFHPYDRWGFAGLSQEESLTYLEYCVVRLGAHHNVWWSLANEFDLLPSKKQKDWEEYAELIGRRDSYCHLLSIHQCIKFYPKRDWMTHCSIQSGDLCRIPEWREEYNLPMIIDECGYEGDIEYSWGNLSAFKMAHRFWYSVTKGTYCTHGETFHREDEVLWWAKGGVLHGESAPRIRFLRQVLESLPESGAPLVRRIITDPNDSVENAGQETHPIVKVMSELTDAERKYWKLRFTPNIIAGKDFRLEYLGYQCRSVTTLDLPEGGKYRVEVLDIWEMTRTTETEGAYGQTRIHLPGKEGIAILTTRLKGEGLE